MASSTEEVSVANNDLSGGSRREEATADFGVFKDFDFLEYESESIEVQIIKASANLAQITPNHFRVKAPTISIGA